MLETTVLENEMVEMMKAVVTGSRALLAVADRMMEEQRATRERLRTLPRKELYSLLDKAESDEEREKLRDAIYYQGDLFEFANNLETARAIWRICPTFVMAPEYPQALKEACRAASEFEGHEVDQEANYLEDAVFESGLLPKLSGKEIEEAFKASLPKLMGELAESQSQ